MHDVRWNQLPYMAQQWLGQLETWISHRKFEFFDLNVTFHHESASGGPSVPSMRVENCNLHGNSIMPTSKSVPPGRGHDWLTVVFDSYRRRWSVSACRFIADCNILIEELELSASLALILVNSLLCHIWKLVPPDVTHVISFTRLPLSQATIMDYEYLAILSVVY